MPIPAAVLALAPLFASITGGIISGNRDKKNAEAQERQNEQDRQFQREMYEWSRWDAQSDWKREAEYNSPAQQMQRLREAGLNPNLIYGKGADNTIGSIRAGQMTGGSQPAPKRDPSIVPNAIDKFYQLNNMQAQLRNINANTDNLN